MYMFVYIHHEHNFCFCLSSNQTRAKPKDLLLLLYLLPVMYLQDIGIYICMSTYVCAHSRYSYITDVYIGRF